MPAVPNTPTTPAGASLQVILLTYRPSALADDIFQAVAATAADRPGLQLVVAWGGEAGPTEDRWAERVARWRERGADVVLMADPSPRERVRLALAQPHDWVLPLADDDPVAVNYVRALADAAAQAAPDVTGIVASNHVQNFDGRTQSSRLAGWMQTQAEDRLLDMLARPGLQGTLFWAAYRHAVMADWLDFALALPFQPSYLDQFLPLMAASRGRIAVASEETVLLKDDRHWQDLAASTDNNARYYPGADMSLYHEWFWAADMWAALGPQLRDGGVPAALKQWALQMFGHMLGSFEARRRHLGLSLSPAHGAILEVLRVVANWLDSDPGAGGEAEGLDELTRIAQQLRAQWVADGQAPQLDLAPAAPEATAEAVCA